MQLSRLTLLTALSALTTVVVGAESFDTGDGNTAAVAPWEKATTEEQDAAIRAYWTPARINAAMSPMPRLEAPAQDEPNHVSEVEPDNESMGLNTSSIDGKSSVFLIGSDASDALGLVGLGGEEPLPSPTAFGDGVYNYPPPSNTYAIPETWYGSFPLRAVGKLYFSQGGLNFVCSGSVLNSGSGKVIQTAGHCLSNGAGTFSTNVLFRPAHRPAWTAPFGSWTAQNLAVKTAWHQTGNLCQDLGCIIANPQGGQTIEARVGGFGWLYNAPRTQHWSIFGYPAAGSWSGSAMVLSESSWNLNDAPNCVVGDPTTMGAGWGQAGGASGGPWIVKYRPQQGGANNYVNGVNSYGYTTPDQPLQIYSPYFGDNWKSLYDLCDSI